MDLSVFCQEAPTWRGRWSRTGVGGAVGGRRGGCGGPRHPAVSPSHPPFCTIADGGSDISSVGQLLLRDSSVAVPRHPGPRSRPASDPLAVGQRCRDSRAARERRSGGPAIGRPLAAMPDAVLENGKASGSGSGAPRRWGRRLITEPAPARSTAAPASRSRPMRFQSDSTGLPPTRKAAVRWLERSRLHGPDQRGRRLNRGRAGGRFGVPPAGADGQGWSTIGAGGLRGHLHPSCGQGPSPDTCRLSRGATAARDARLSHFWWLWSP